MHEMQRFGKNILNATDIFVKTPLSIGFVNLKPIMPGHVLVSPKRVVPRLADMTKDEVTDLFQAVHRIGPVIEKVYKGTALTVALQDGNAAGQSVEHVHVHLIPRRPGDFARNDDIYEQIHAWNKIEDANRKPRTSQEMAEEAAALAVYFEDAK